MTSTLEKAAKAMQEGFPFLRTGLNKDGNWFGEMIELSIFEKAVERAIDAMNIIILPKDAEPQVGDLVNYYRDCWDRPYAIVVEQYDKTGNEGTISIGVLQSYDDVVIIRRAGKLIKMEAE